MPFLFVLVICLIGIVDSAKALPDEEFLEITVHQLTENKSDLQRFTRLKYLKISPGEITQSNGHGSGAVSNLVELRFLKELDLRGNEIDDALYKSLKSALPECAFFIGPTNPGRSVHDINPNPIKVPSILDSFDDNFSPEFMRSLGSSAFITLAAPYFIEKGLKSEGSIGKVLDTLRTVVFKGSYDGTLKTLSVILTTTTLPVFLVSTNTIMGYTSWYLSRSRQAWSNFADASEDLRNKPEMRKRRTTVRDWGVMFSNIALVAVTITSSRLLSLVWKKG
jgi:hypothetical protein